MTTTILCEEISQDQKADAVNQDKTQTKALSRVGDFMHRVAWALWVLDETGPGGPWKRPARLGREWGRYLERKRDGEP